MSKKKKAVRKVTASKKTLLNRLAEILYDFLPLSSRSKNAITFTTIFAESKIEGYLKGCDVKLQALEKGMTEVYRRHERLPTSIIRKIIPAALNYREYIRRPLSKKEINDLSDTLYKLDIDMRAELEEIEIDETLPLIKVPPKELENRLYNHNLDPNISSEPLQLFSDGHFNESVRKAAERLENVIQKISNIDSLGRDLMAQAFKDDTYINTLNIKPQNKAGFVDGFKFLTMGAMASIRNVFSHADEEGRTPEECYEMLLFINWIFRFLKLEHTG